MKKILCIILTLFIFSCEGLEEETELLEYDNYMNEGWLAFESSDWDIAMDLFNIGLNRNSSNYSEAYSGLGWTFLYKANRLYGESNQSTRDSLRILAGISFDNAEKENIYDGDIWSDILAGMTYIYSYRADSAWFIFYNDNDFQFDPLLEDQMIYYSNKTISKSDELLEFDAEYDFQFDPCVNVDNIRYIRARTFLRLGEFDSMISELNTITSISCSEVDILTSIDEGIECLNNLSNILTSCN